MLSLNKRRLLHTRLQRHKPKNGKQPANGEAGNSRYGGSWFICRD